MAAANHELRLRVQAEERRRREALLKCLGDRCGAPTFRDDPFHGVRFIGLLIGDEVDHLDAAAWIIVSSRRNRARRLLSARGELLARVKNS